MATSNDSEEVSSQTVNNTKEVEMLGLQEGGRQPVQSTSSAVAGVPDTRSSSAPDPLKSKRDFGSKSNLPTANSPKPSRESSPIRQIQKTTTGSKLPRSRKNSQENGPPSAIGVARAATTPTMSPTTITNRALSSAGPAQSQPSGPNEPSNLVTKAQRVGRASGDSTPHWPASPRLRSPAPSANSRQSSTSSPRKSDQDPPSVSVRRAATVATTSSADERSGSGDSERETHGLTVGMRTPARGASGASTLETVQENSLPGTPAIELSQPPRGARSSEDDRPVKTSDNPTEDVPSRVPKLLLESGSESGGNKSDGKRAQRLAPAGSSTKPNIVAPGKSQALKSKTGEGSTSSMTVETETVTSIPQVALGVGAGERGTGSGSLRLQPSRETIRPKKEKKKTVRKAPSINSGTGELPKRIHFPHAPKRRSTLSRETSRSPEVPSSLIPFPQPCDERRSSISSTVSSISSSIIQAVLPSMTSSYTCSPAPANSVPSVARLANMIHRTASSKADIFEAKVASAVDEANSSDSEETFVYESNPPEPHSRPSRYHSRTPSATSLASQLDQRGGLRSIQGVIDGHRSVKGKRSMKFTNNPYSNGAAEGDNTERDGNGQTVNIGSVRENAVRASQRRHIGHFGRHGRGHASIFDSDSPFPHAAKSGLSQSGPTSRHNSRPQSPRNPQNMRLAGGERRMAPQLQGYDMDVEGADDERTPLVGSTRSSRGRHGRRPNSASILQMEYNQQRRKSWLARCAGCSLVIMMVILVVSGAIGFLVATTKPLHDVKIKEIQNVLASEQEIMLDLLVQAVNPNIVTVSVGHMDVNVFAKSRHVNSEKLWRGDSHLEMKKRRQMVQQKDQSIYPESSGEDWADPHNIQLSGGVDEGTDPIDDPEGDSQTMLLGRIFEFDSALNFEGSPLKWHPTISVGEVRLAQPGNKTEKGGSERWERVIQYPFELIVRGVLKYQLPLSSKLRTSPIGASIIVHPEEGVDELGRMRTEKTQHSPATV